MENEQNEENLREIIQTASNWHKKIKHLVPLEIAQAIEAGEKWPFEKFTFLLYFDDNAKYHDAVEGLTLTMYDECHKCTVSHLREDQMGDYCANPADGILVHGSSGKPCIRGPENWKGSNMYWKDFIKMGICIEI